MALNRSKHSKEPVRRTTEGLGPNQMSMDRQQTREVYASREVIDEFEETAEERMLRNKLELARMQQRTTRKDRQHLLDEQHRELLPIRPNSRYE